MPKLKPLKPEEVLRVLERMGFGKIRQSGSHVVLVTVPIHRGKDVAKGTFQGCRCNCGRVYEPCMKGVIGKAGRR